MNLNKIREHANNLRATLRQTSPVIGEGEIAAMMNSSDPNLKRTFISELSHLLALIPSEPAKPPSGSD